MSDIPVITQPPINTLPDGFVPPENHKPDDNGLTTITVPNSYDLPFIYKKADVQTIWGEGWPSESSPNHKVMSFVKSEAAKVVAVLENYDYLYLVYRREKLLIELAARRWEETQSFVFDGVRTQADPAIAAVTGAAFLGQFLPEGSKRKWKLADGEFRDWTIPEIVQFGAAIATHIQKCFDREEELSIAILSAGNVEVLEGIDIDAGWPL